MIKDHPVAKVFYILSKSEIVSIMALATLTKIEDLERDRLEKLNQLEETNLSYYLEVQDQTIQNWNFSDLGFCSSSEIFKKCESPPRRRNRFFNFLYQSLFYPSSAGYFTEYKV
jgi:hypothetical protein